MCGRYASQLPPEEIGRLFSTAGDLGSLGLNWNVAPTRPAMVARRHLANGERRLDVLRWGLLPRFMTDACGGFSGRWHHRRRNMRRTKICTESDAWPECP